MANELGVDHQKHAAEHRQYMQQEHAVMDALSEMQR